VELWGEMEREELEKIMMDYVRWIFRLDYCTPRYVITTELGMDKLKIGWGIRLQRFEERIKNRVGSLVELCWREKEEGERGNKGRDREHSEIEVIERERNIARAEEYSKILETK